MANDKDDTEDRDEDSGQGSGTVNNQPRKKKNRSKTKAGRKASVANRRRSKRKKTGGAPLPKPIQQKIETGLEDVADELVSKIADMTVRPFQRLMSPAGIGSAIAAATKSPVAGMVVAGALSTTGNVVKGLSSFVKALQDQLQINQAKLDSKNGMASGNTDILDALIELVHNEKLILDEAKLQRVALERQELASLEKQRELSNEEKERQEVLKQLVDTLDKLGGPSNFLS